MGRWGRMEDRRGEEGKVRSSYNCCNGSMSRQLLQWMSSCQTKASSEQWELHMYPQSPFPTRPRRGCSRRLAGLFSTPVLRRWELIETMYTQVCTSGSPEEEGVWAKCPDIECQLLGQFHCLLWEREDLQCTNTLPVCVCVCVCVVCVYVGVWVCWCIGVWVCVCCVCVCGCGCGCVYV